MKNIRLVALCLVCWYLPASAQEAPVPEISAFSFSRYFQSEWDKSKTTDIYIPVYTWHNRNYYSPDQIKNFNEAPSGLGMGKSYRDEESSWRGYYAMLFADSFNKIEPIAGYFYAKNLLGAADTFSFGLGYTLFLTAREDTSYLPLPGIAPLLTTGYKNLTLNAAYMPGKVGAGNICFVWLVYGFN